MQPDRSIPFYNIILRCDSWEEREPPLPEGFCIRSYLPGDERAWAEWECAVGDFDSVGEAERYFAETYLRSSADGRERLLFAVDPSGKAVGSCLAWHDERGGVPVASLHWLIVEEPSRRMGLGRALVCAVMNRFAERGELPVYLHTQPWSWFALPLYFELGFRWQRSDTFARYENQYADAMRTLTEHLGKESAAFFRKYADG